MKSENKPYISQGNRKMSFPTWSLPACTTCKLGRTKLCMKHCYAKKAERCYPGVLPRRKKNLAASKTLGFVRAMINLIATKDPEFFRIHESGDFYSQSYLDSWCAIARACQSVKFLAFTKAFSLDYSNVPNNVQIIWSVWPDTNMQTVPPGPRAYAGDCQNMRPAIECPGTCDNCGMCWSIDKVGKDVHFNIH